MSGRPVHSVVLEGSSISSSNKLELRVSTCDDHLLHVGACTV